MISLEDFEADAVAVAAAAPAARDAAEIEAARVAAYEEGYKSGWDDAAKAADTERRAVGEELARNLRDLGFTYFEARGALMDVMKSFLTDLFDKLFPHLLPDAVAASIVAEMTGMAGDICDGRTTILVSPDDAEVVQRILDEAGIDTADLREEPSLASGQARLLATPGEISIDAERLTRSLRDALGPAPNLKELAHG